jgi:hypothetical protein
MMPWAELACDLPTERYAWMVGYNGRAVVREVLADGRLRFDADGGEFRVDLYNEACAGRAPHLIVAGLGTAGLAVGDAVQLELSETLPAPEDGDQHAEGRIFLEATGALVAAWGGMLGGYPLRSGGPILNVRTTAAVCRVPNPDARCTWTSMRSGGFALSVGDDEVAFYGGPTEALLDGARFLVAGGFTSYTYNYDCEEGIADNAPVNRSGQDLRIVRWVE